MTQNAKDDFMLPTHATCDPDQLRSLAASAGLVDNHYDAFGNFTRVSDEILAHALDALGIPVPCDAPPAEPGRPILPSTLIHRASSGRLGVPLYWPNHFGAGRWDIRWEPETGEGAPEPFQGLFQPETLHSTDDSAYRRLEIDLAGAPFGYHRLHIEGQGSPDCEVPLIIVPDHCWLPEGTLEDDTVLFWGVTCQVHGLRSLEDWGMGDFAALSSLSRQLGAEGGDLVGINPLNALFLTRPLHASPYSPNSRLFLNPLYIAIKDIPETPTTGEIAFLERDLDSLRAPDLIDLGRVVPRKLSALKATFQTFQKEHRTKDTPRGRDFRRFVVDGGVYLEKFARFQALSTHFASTGSSWETWPEDYHDADSAAVDVFARDHRNEVDFHLWCQFEADRQLGLCAEAARSSGQRLGIYRDLAIGSDPSGADVWMLGDTLVRGVAVGAPPDPMNALGQDWGFSPFHPTRLQEEGYESFRRLIRANMRHAGVLRIDHVLGLMRLFCIVRGYPCRDGLYMKMPFEDLLGVLCLESQRARCMVVGEDLGTIPEGFRERLHDAGILSSRLFYFERHYHTDGSLIQPNEYPRLAAVSANSHDLPTLWGFWAGRDLAWKNELNLFPSDGAREAESRNRFNDRPMIRETLGRAGIVLDPTEDYTPPANLVPAICTWLARTPSLLVSVQMEDILEETEQANLPGTVEEHPNWRRRLTVPVEILKSDGRLSRIAGIFADARRGAKEPSS